MLYYFFCRWFDSVLVTVLDLRSVGPGLKSHPLRDEGVIDIAHCAESAVKLQRVKSINVIHRAVKYGPGHA